MPNVLSILIHSFNKEYSVLRDIYILMEETTLLTNLALEDEDTDRAKELIYQRQQYNQFIKERECAIKKTEDMAIKLLGWEYFSMARLLTEVDLPQINELDWLTNEIHNIICSLARMDIINYHLQQGKINQENKLQKLKIIRRRAERAYLDQSFGFGK